MAENTYGDFGRKIGNARKDLAGFRKLGGFDVDDIAEWTDVERDKHIVKKEVFVKPDYQKMLDSGEYSRDALYFQSRIYKALPTAPNTAVYLQQAKREGTSEIEALRQAQDDYIRVMNAFRSTLAEVKDTKGIAAFSVAIQKLYKTEPMFQKTFGSYYNQNFSMVNPWRKLNRELVTSNYDYAHLNIQLQKDKFLYDDRAKALSEVDVFQYNGQNIYKQYQVTFDVKGRIPFNGGDPQKAYDESRHGFLRNPAFTVEGDHLIITGETTIGGKGKTVEEAIEAAGKELREMADSETRSEYGRFGLLTDIELTEGRNTEPNRTRFVINRGGSEMALYSMEGKPEADLTQYKEGSWVAMTAYRSSLPTQIIGINYDTKENAEKAAIEFVEKAQAFKKAVSNAVKKGRLAPPQLLHIHRVGEDYLDGADIEVVQKKDENGQPMFRKDIDGSFELDKNGKQIPVLECPEFQTTLGFSAGEFGNWESQADRRANLNMAFEAFKDMSKAMGIAESDMSLGGDLALAWGSRGKGGIHAGVAHFEPDANVINLTKMRGAGALGHEWGHAMDYAIARMEKRTAIDGSGLFETDIAKKNSDSILHGVMNAMMYGEDGRQTQFYKDAQAIDKSYARADKGYWASSVEMYARAFHVYLQDKLKEQGIRNDYLCGHAEISPVRDEDGNVHYAYPRGAERERINKEFDKVIEVLKEKGFFHEQGFEKEHQLIHSQDGITQEENETQVKEALDGQLEFDFSEPEKKEKKTKAEKEDDGQLTLGETDEPVKEAEEPAQPQTVYGTTLDAENLQVGDVIRLNGTTAVDSRMKPVQLPPEYARVTEVDNDHIEFVCSPDDPTVPEKWDNGRTGYMTTNDKHWSDKLVEQGFEVVSKAPEEMHIVYLRSGDDKSIDAMRRYIDMSFENANWNDDNSAVELPDRDFKDFKERIGSPDLGDYMKEVAALVELSYDEPFPEDRAEPDFYHTIYLKGDATDILRLATTLDEITDFKAEISEDFQTIKILDSDLEKYNAWLQSDEVQKNTDLIGHISRIDQSLDEPIPFKSEVKLYEEPKVIEDTGLESIDRDFRENYERETMVFEIGTQTTPEGEKPLTYSASVVIDGDKRENEVVLYPDTELTPEVKSLINKADKVLEASVDENIKIAEEALRKIEEAKKMAEQKNNTPEKKGWRPAEKSSGEAPQKRSFPIPANLKKLEETMRDHKPFAAMAISTTNKPNDPAVEPVRMVVQEYVYDEELKRYKEGIGFDKMVKCSQEQLDFMLTCESYDYFGSAGLDKDAYIRGEGVLSKEQFNAEFLSFMKALEQDEKTLLVINGGAEFAGRTLAKISPEATQAVLTKDRERTAVSQTTLTGEYFKKHGIKKPLTLENLRDEIVPKPSGSFRDMLMENSPRMEDFQKMSKEEFCKTAKVTSYQYDATVADIKNHEAKIIGTDNRVAMIARFAETVGREAKILESEFDAHWREASVADRQAMSEQGKERYANADFERKLEILVSHGVVEPEVVMDRDSDCDLNKFLNLMEKKGVDGDGHNKGFVVLQAATTGFDKRGVGDPIQVSVAAYALKDNGTIEAVGGIGNLTIQASERAIQTAISRAEATGREHFDAFAYTGIDVNAYRAGEGVTEQFAANAELKHFFEQFPPAEYPIISNGSGKNDPSITFSQEALRAIGTQKAFSDSHNSVDFTQVIKEYSYMAYHKEGIESVLGNESEIKSFSLDNVVKSNESLLEVLTDNNPDVNPLRDTASRVNATVALADEIRQKDMELHRPEQYQKFLKALEGGEEQEAPQAEAPAPVQPEPEKAAEAEMEGSAPSIGGMGGLGEIGTGMGGTGASVGGTSKTVETDYDEPDFDEEPPSVTDLMDKSDLESLVGGEIVEDTREHGKLYSDKEGDTRDVVIVEGGVTKVGEVKIPHVSEAVKEQPKEAEQPKEEAGSRRMADKTEKVEKRHGKARFTPDKSNSSQAQPAPTAPPAPDNNKMIEELMNLVKSQQELISRQQEQLASKDAMIKMTNNTVVLLTERLTEVMDKQTELLSQIAEQNREPEREAPKALSEMSLTERVAKVEVFRDEISELRNASSSDKVRQALSKANDSLAVAANEMDKENHPKQPTTPNKAG